MRILVIGSGGREHSLCWKLSRSGYSPEIHCAPGNAGIGQIANCHEVQADDIEGLVNLVHEIETEMAVIGPEVPLTLGLADRLEESGIKVIGPCANAAQLEGSKAFMKELCVRQDIPTAVFESFTDPEKAKNYIRDADFPVVIKADGLAAGKGVVIPETESQAFEVIDEMLSGKSFGRAGRKIVIEEFLNGPEVSFFALCDGQDVIPFGTAEDHKRAFDDDKGPNTGGMGAFSPSPLVDNDLADEIMKTIIFPTFNGLKEQGIAFKGVLYAGLILVNGRPKLLEYNTRFGDPECQALMMRLESDLVDIFKALASGNLQQWKNKIDWASRPAITVVMAARGYPGSYPKNTPLKGLGKIRQDSYLQLFHAGTRKGKHGEIVNSGGRVLNMACTAETIEAARDKAYENLELIEWPEGFFRRDIALKALKKDYRDKKTAI